MRARSGGIHEVQATGILAAPPESVFRIVCDARRFRELVPHLTQMRVIEKNEQYTLAYQRLEWPALAPRDFTVRHACAAESMEDGRIQWVNRWFTDNGAGPPRADGVVRVEVNEGSWMLRALDGGTRTHATYTVRIEPGGGIPTFVVDAALGLQLPQLFAAVERMSRRSVSASP